MIKLKCDHQEIPLLGTMTESLTKQMKRITSVGFTLLMLNSGIVLAEESSRLEQLEKELNDSKRLLRELAKKINELENALERNQISTTPKPPPQPAPDDETNERLDVLEDTLLDVEEKIGSRAVVNAFDAVKVDIGGFFHSAYTYIDGEDGSATSFNRQNFELLISAELNEQWSAFFAGGFLREADDPFTTGSVTEPAFNSRNKNPLIIGWVNFSQSDAFNVRMGRFITPHGIINIEHFPATLLDPEQPQFLRPFSGDTIFPNFSTGIQIHGSTYLNGDHKLQSSVYYSNFSGNPEDDQFGGMVEYELTKDLTIGLNYSHGKRISNDSYDMVGLHAMYDYGDFVLKTELYSTDEDTELTDDRVAGYVEPSWKLSPEWILFYRYDYLDNGVQETTENAIGINYLPYSNVRLRAIYTQKQFDSYGDPLIISPLPDIDADILQLSGTFSF